ncbi:unnamed protein product [Paramecium pentaurelia]|uniref:VWFA domain-containing protein n=1 Tax=Paramecium pentaurelia TaxID=43138 RepID=A0A8S1U9L0_9CILI|nr:unnamed protein product [Paramecium pentaurelia]
MELKNQILLVILIPIILILMLAVLQVGLLGFVSIPSFQDSLLDFHINRHLNGLQIEMNIIEQEIYIQYQAYFNQIFGVSAHLRHYCFGEFQNYSSWTLDDKQLSLNAFTSTKKDSQDYKIAWSHSKYQTLTELQNQSPQLYFQLTKAAQSLILSDIIINNTRSLKQDLNLNTTSDTSSDAEALVPINYAATMIHCTDSFVIRFPQFTEVQQQKLTGFNVSQWLPEIPMSLDPTLNFTMKYDRTDEFTSGPSISLTQIVHQTDTTKCYMTAKVLNSYLEDLTTRHLQQHQSQGEQEHQLFVAIINEEYTVLSPKNYSDRNVTQAIVQYINETKQLSNSSYTELISKMDAPIYDKIKELRTNDTLNSTQLIYSFGSYKFYLLFSEVVTTSSKRVSIVTAPENGRRYVYIEPEVNDFKMPTFILIHYFEENVLIQELYEGTSLNNVRILEIIVLIVIIVLSVVIFLFVWYTATRIGLSFEQPIKVLTEFMNSIDIQNMDQEEELINYQDYFNSFEIKSLFQTMNIFVTTIKYSNQKYSNSKHSDAIALMELSRAKDFYKKEIGNMSAVGICANNIGILHMKGGRVFEAVNEMEEAIYIAKLELMEIKELKKWCTTMMAALQEPNLYQNLRLKLKGLANKFRQQIEITWIKKIQKKQQEDQKNETNTQMKAISSSQRQKNISNTSKNISTTVIHSKNIPHMALINPQSSCSSKNTQLASVAVNSVTTPINKKKRTLTYEKSLNESKKGLQPINQVDQENSNYYSPQLSPNVSNNRSKYLGQSYNQSSIMQSQRLDMKESIINYEDKQNNNQLEERERNNSGSSDVQMSELQMIKEKLSELTKKKKLAKAKLLNRQFQLAQFMFNICMQYSDVFIPETLKLFTDFEATAEKDQRFTQSKIVRLINLHVKKALCYIQIGDISNFQLSEQKAEEYYNKLIQDNANLEQAQQNEEQDFNFVDMFKNVPKEVLFSKIRQLKAIYQLLRGNFKTAAEILTEIIEMGDYYDPEVRDFCLMVLEKIFKLFNISPQPIQQFRNQISINVYEIVFMIDYSKEMNIEQINLSHSICTKIFSILQPQDLIGMYGFNNSLHEAFPLQPKGTYKDLLNKQLYMAITAPGGNSRLYQALRFAVKNFFEHKINISNPHKTNCKSDDQKSNQKKECNNFTIHEENEQDLSQSQFPPLSNNDDPKQKLNESQTEGEQDTESDNDDIQFFKNGNNVNFNGKSEDNNDQQQYDFRSRYKFICIFTEINKHMCQKQEEKLKQLLEKNQVDLMVFNIANQNANMLELKKLSKITPRSIFVNATANLEQLFGKSRQNQLQKKMYLEFF